MTVSQYQYLVDRGWRRSGKYLYKPDISESCCSQYTIRLKVSVFSPSKGNRKTVAKMKRELGNGFADPEPSYSNCGYELSKIIDHAENSNIDIVTVKSEFDQEVFEIYRKYQASVHNDKLEDISPESFTRFLIDTPLAFEESTEMKLATGYGSYQQKYYLRSKLIAVSFIDILPYCVSGVYFVYDPEYSQLSLGTYSSLREIAYTQRLETFMPEIQWYYLGLYIHSCPKMRYKSSFKPSELLCPKTLNWVGFKEIEPVLEKNVKSILAGEDGVPLTDPIPVSSLSGAEKDIGGSKIYIYDEGIIRIVSYKNLVLSNPAASKLVNQLCQITGNEIFMNITFVIGN